MYIVGSFALIAKALRPIRLAFRNGSCPSAWDMLRPLWTPRRQRRQRVVAAQAAAHDLDVLAQVVELVGKPQGDDERVDGGIDAVELGQSLCYLVRAELGCVTRLQ